MRKKYLTVISSKNLHKTEARGYQIDRTLPAWLFDNFNTESDFSLNAKVIIFCSSITSTSLKLKIP